MLNWLKAIFGKKEEEKKPEESANIESAPGADLGELDNSGNSEPESGSETGMDSGENGE